MNKRAIKNFLVLYSATHEAADKLAAIATAEVISNEEAKDILRLTSEAYNAALSLNNIVSGQPEPKIGD